MGEVGWGMSLFFGCSSTLLVTYRPAQRAGPAPGREAATHICGGPACLRLHPPPPCESPLCTLFLLSTGSFPDTLLPLQRSLPLDLADNSLPLPQLSYPCPLSWGETKAILVPSPLPGPADVPKDANEAGEPQDTEQCPLRASVCATPGGQKASPAAL